MDLAGHAALITGGKRIGAVVARTLRRAGWTSRSPTTGRAPRRTRQRPTSVAAGRRAHVASGRSLAARACGALVDGAADAFGRLDILINMASVYVQRAVRPSSTAADWDASSTSICAPRFSARTPPCRTCAQQGGGRIVNFSDWVARERAAALHGLPAVLRREGRRHRADRGARARARRRQHPRQRHRAGPDRRAAGHDRRGDRRRSRRRRRSDAGAARWRSRRRCSRCSTATSSPARPSASTADGT